MVLVRMRLLVFAAVASCVATGEAAQIGRIEVAMSERLPAARRERWERAGGQQALAGALEAALRRQGRLDSAAAGLLTVTVGEYRMRPGTSPPWLVFGLVPPYRVDHLADGDAIELEVTLREHERVVDRFAVAATRPDLAGPRDATSRAAGLASVAARRVALALAGSSGRPPP